MKRTDFRIVTDSADNRYIAMIDKLTKNHRRDGDETSQQGRMYAMPGFPRCPVASCEKYLAKLNDQLEAFWQKPKTKTVSENDCWYMNVPVGKNTIGDKMKSCQGKNQRQAYGHTAEMYQTQENGK